MTKKIIKLGEGDTIPEGAKFICMEKEFVRMYGWISNLKPYYKNVFFYEVETTYEIKVQPTQPTA